MLPRYFNQKEIDAVYNAVDKFWQRCFYFYVNTGCRPIEPFMGEIEGNWLRIPPEETKGKNWRLIQLTDDLKYILVEMRDFRDTYLDGGLEYARHRAYDIMNRKLNRTIKQLGFKGKSLSLKSFRHTYGIYRVTMLGDIFQVAREMGHRSVTTTEKHYLRFPLERRLADFPSLAKYIEKAENKAVLGDDGYELMDTRAYLRASS